MIKEEGMDLVTTTRDELESLHEGEVDIAQLLADIEASKSKCPIVMPEVEVVERIRTLHLDTISCITVALGKAVEIGGLLTEQKNGMNHGEWQPWVEKNMPFSSATARNYMQLWDRRETLQLLNVSNLKTAYKVVRTTMKPICIEYEEDEGIFSVPAKKYFFGTLNQEQRRQWVAEWILNSIKYQSKDVMSLMIWTVGRFTFEEFYDTDENSVYNRFWKPYCKTPRGLSKKAKNQRKKDVAEFLEKWKGIDILSQPVLEEIWRVLLTMSDDNTVTEEMVFEAATNFSASIA
jgi:hypothetical protein